MNDEADSRFDPALDLLERVVWKIEVRDPRRLTAAGIGDRTRAAMTEMAAAHGCAFGVCIDDDAYDLTLAEVPYYRWDISVPRQQHLDRDTGIPRAITALGAWLRTQLPAGLDDWTYEPDLAETWQAAAADALRAEARELLVPLEVALLGLRRDGAQEIEPLLRCWSGEERPLAGTYALLLGKDPDVTGRGPVPWLVLNAGHIPPAGFWTTPAGAELARFSCTDDPILTRPRPAATTWWISVDTAPFVFSPVPTATIPTAAPSAFTPARPRPTATPGARHQWTGTDAAALVERATTDLLALFPHLQDSAARP